MHTTIYKARSPTLPAHQPAIRMLVEVPVPVISGAGGKRCQHQQGIHAHRIKARAQRSQNISIFLPDNVPIADEKWLISKKRQGFFDPAAGFQQLGPLVGIDDFSAVALCQMIANPLGFMMQIDNNAGHTGVFQPVEQAVKQCPPGNFREGFGGSSARARMRVPSPAASTMARVIGPTSGGLLRSHSSGGPIGCMGFQPIAHRGAASCAKLVCT